MSDMPDRWKPNVTVSAIIERDGRFLLVEEETADGLKLNVPAGHLDPAESPIDACAREVLEETAFSFTPQALVGIYMNRFTRTRTGADITYVRFAFTDCSTTGLRWRAALDSSSASVIQTVRSTPSSSGRSGWWVPSSPVNAKRT